MYKQLILTFIVAGIPWLACGLVAQEKEKGDKRDLLAKDAAEQFVKAIKSQDIDKVMQTVDVPFFLEGKVTNDREKLKNSFEPMLAEVPPELEFQFRDLTEFGTFPASFLRDHEHDLLMDLLDKKDRIVLFQVENRVIAVPVRVQETKAIVVGIRSDLSLLTLAMAAHRKEQEDKSKVQAKSAAQTTVQRFLQAAKAKDLDGLLNLTDVPWYSDGNQVIKNREELKKMLKSTWVDVLDQRRILPVDVFLVISFGGIRELLQEQRQELADQVFAKEDWAVFVRGERKDKRGIIFVRVREGQGKVIGVSE